MTYVPNLIFMTRYVKHHLSVDRLWDFNTEKIKSFQTKQLRKIIKNARKTDLYFDKYDKEKITEDSIQSIEDIKKIPFTTKQDLRDYGTQKTLPKDFNIKKAYKVDTSGSTGKPVSIYRDLESIALEMTTTTRILRSHHLPSKTRISNIGDFTLANSYDEECINKALSDQLGIFKKFYSNQYQNIYTGKKISEIMKDLNNFQPGLIIAYPGVLIGLLKLKQEGKGKNVSPSHIIYSGGVLDPYTKKQIENAFDTHVLGLYTGTESGVIAFQCPYGNFHVQSDLVHIEAVDSQGESVKPGKHGHVVVTRLYGGGTPIIRYTGMDDIITPIEGECKCDMNTPLIKNVEGRSVDSIVLPDGRIFPAATFTLIPGEVAQDYKVDIIQRFQIIQNKKDKIDIRIVIDDNKRKLVKNLDKFFNEIKKRYQKLVGKDVTINVKEVKKVKEDKRSPVNLSSIVISNVDHKDWI